MKRSTLVVVLLVAAATIVNAQWMVQASGTSELLRSVCFADASRGWAVGANGTIRYTTNGGNLWVGQTSGVTDTLYSIHFPQPGYGWIVGQGGVILRTTNSGTVWTPQSSGVTTFLRSVRFRDVNNGWAVGYLGTILRTTNAGTQWAVQTSGTVNALFSVSFADLNNGWAIGRYGTIRRTTNGGNQWTAQTSGTTAFLRSVCFADANNGWVVGDAGTILRTTNGGILWTAVASGTSYDLYACYATDVNHVWVAGIGGTILNTTNGGSQWTQLSSGTPRWLTSVHSFGTANGWAVGDAGTIMYTAPNLAMVTVAVNSGWNLISNPVTVMNDSVRALYPTSITGYAFSFVGGYVQDYTMENGAGYWGKFPSAISQPVTGFPRTMDSVSVRAGWNMVGTISQTVDTSTIVSIPPGLRVSRWFGYSSGYITATQLFPGNAYWVKSSGVGKFILANTTSPGSPRMQAAVSSAPEALNTLTITDSKGASQTLLFGDAAWNELPLEMFGMPPPPPVGAFDTRFETAEGGAMVQTYVAKTSNVAEFRVTIQADAYPLTVAWKVNHAAYQLMDDLGGKGFSPRELLGEGSLTITNSAVNKITLQLMGDSPRPEEFALSQNYPNPFNPATTIKYNLPIDSYVSLKLFNTIGQEVATLVNEEQKAGYKSVVWKPTHVASGIYYYRLDAGTFVQTMKLILLK